MIGKDSALVLGDEVADVLLRLAGAQDGVLEVPPGLLDLGRGRCQVPLGAVGELGEGDPGQRSGEAELGGRATRHCRVDGEGAGVARPQDGRGVVLGGLVVAES